MRNAENPNMLAMYMRHMCIMFILIWMILLSFGLEQWGDYDKSEIYLCQKNNIPLCWFVVCLHEIIIWISQHFPSVLSAHRRLCGILPKQISWWISPLRIGIIPNNH